MKKKLQTFRNLLSKGLGIGLLSLSLLLFGTARAQLYYSAPASLTGLTYTQISGGTVIKTAAGIPLIGGDQDDGAALVTIPFVFTYNGINYNQVTFCANGWIGLGNQTGASAAQSRAPANLFTSTLPNNIIAPWWKDMGANFPVGTGAMVHGLIGTDVYAFEWRNAIGDGFTDGSTNTINFQVVLYGPGSSNPGRIELLYGPTNGTVTLVAAIGIENLISGTGNYYNIVTGNTNTTTLSSAWPGNGTGYRFDHIASVSAVTTASGGNWSSPGTWMSGSVPTSNDAIEVTAGSTLTLDQTGINFIKQLTINGSVNFATAATAVNIATDLTINSGGTFDVFNGTTGKTLNVAGNITNNGTIDFAKTGSVLVLNGVVAQTIGGAGTIVSNTIASLTLNNSAVIPVINWNWSNIIVPTTLTFTKGWVALGALNSITLGTSGSSLGTLTYTAGGFTNGTFTRWTGTTGTGTTIAAGTTPTFGTGSFPFGIGSPTLGYVNGHFHKSTAALTTAGTFSVLYDGTLGTNTLGAPVVENALTFDKQTNATWTVSTGNGYASSANHSFAVQAQNAYTAISGNARLLIGGALVGTHQAGSILPLAERTAVPFASIAGAYTLGIAAGEIPTVSVTSGAWNNSATWSNGIPSCGQAAVINAADSVWFDGSMSSSSTAALVLNGKLSVSGSSLTVGCATNYYALTANGRLYVSGGTFNINGSLNLPAASVFSQTGGNINVDGNAAGVAANSVPSGTAIVSIATGSVTLSGGVFTVVDPHAATTSTSAFSYTGGTAINSTTGWTLKFGDGISTDAGGAVATPVGYVLNMAGSKIVVDSLVIDAGVTGTNRFVTINTTVGCNNMNITANGEARSSVALSIAKNLVNNGILTNTAGAVTFGTFLSSTSGVSSNAQVISGTGVFRNLTASSTANFTTLTINNNSPTGVTFASAQSLLSGSNTGTVSGTFTITNGIINTGANTFILGISASTLGTLSYTAGGFGAGSSFSRWWGTAAAGPTITAGTLPTAGVGTYPFATLQSAAPFSMFSRTVNIRQAVAATAGGRITVKHNDIAGSSTVSIVDGAYTAETRSNTNWAISTTGITGTPTYTLAISAQNTLELVNGNGRITLASGPISGTHQAGTTLPHVQRAGIPLADLTNTLYIGAANADVPFYTVASGNWEDGVTWNKGTVPGCSDSTVIRDEHFVTVNATTASARAIGINVLGKLTVSNSTLTVGCTLNNASIRVNGNLTVSGGTVNINGGLFSSQTGRVYQTGGAIVVDGNNNGNAATSISGNVIDLTAATDTSLILSGGSLTIVDPAVTNGSFVLRINASKVIGAGNHTLNFGDGVSTNPGGSFGFSTTLFPGTFIGTLGNVIVNTNSSSALNRFVDFTGSTNILGNLTVTTGSLRLSSTLNIKGNIVNNDTLITVGTIIMRDYTLQTSVANTVAQSISGTGKFLNLVASPTAGIASLTVNNSSVGGVTIGAKLSVSGTLTLTRGILNTNATDSFRLGTNTVAGTLSGGHDSAYINGPFYRTFAASRTASGTYSVATLYPVGKGGRYLPLWIDPTTNAGGAIVLSGEAFTANAGTLGAGAISLSALRWQAFVGTGVANFVSANLRLSDSATAFTTSTKILYSPTAAGAYAGIASAITYAAGPPKTLTTGAQIAAADFSGYFAYGELVACLAPTNQPTSMLTANMNTTSFSVSFTAATSAPSHYLVVRYPSGGTVTAPVNNTSYAVAAALGTGTVVANTNGLTFNQTGLTANTTYDYYIYSYNNSGCFGPVYNTTNPLLTSVTTCATAVTTPTSATAVNVTTSDFTARWSKNASPTATYFIDVSTNTGFTSFVPGYQNYSVGTDTFFIVSGIPSSTFYFYRVRTLDGVCISANSANQSVATLCGPVLSTSLPYIETFDGVTLPNMPYCTARENVNADAAQWVTVNTPIPVGMSGSALKYEYNVNEIDPASDWFFTRGLDLTGGTSYALSFKYGNVDIAYGEKMMVKYGTSATSAAMTTMIVDYPNITDGVVHSSYFLFTPPTSGTYYVGFYAYSVANQWRLFVDSIKVDLGPTCAFPQSLNVTSITTTSATLNWTEPASIPSNGYQYYLSTSNTAPTAPTTPTGTSLSGTSFNLSTLASSTIYYLWMRSDCGSGVLSSWNTLPLIFKTPCPVASLPLAVESYDNAALSVCWNTQVLSGINDWVPQVSNLTLGNYIVPGAKSGARYMAKNYANSDALAFSPVFDMTTAPGGAKISVWIYRSASNDATDRIRFHVNTTQSLSGATQILEVFPLTTVAPVVSASGWYNYTAIIPTSYNSNTAVYVIAQGTTTAMFDSYEMGFDDFKIDTLPSCAPPSALNVTSVGANSAILNWTEPVNIPSGGYDYYISTSPVIPTGATTPTATAVTGTSTPLSVLAPGTAYYVWMRSACSVSNKSSWNDEPLTFATVVNTLPYAENFEGATQGWQNVIISGASDWEFGTPAKTYLNGAHSGVNAWVTRLTGTYQNNTNGAVTSPQFDFSAVPTTPILRFYHKFITEAGYDAMVVEMSVNGGTWTRLNNTLGTGANFNTDSSYAWVNSSSANGPVTPPKFSSAITNTGSNTIYASHDNGWIQSAVYLPGAQGQSNVKVRFRFVSETTGTYEGFALDDIEVVEIATPSNPASAVTVNNATTSSLNVGWANGNGQGRLVVARLTTTSPVVPVDNKLYSPNPVFAALDSTGLGNYVIYAANGSSVVSTGLTNLTDYTYDVYEYNGKYMHIKFTPGSSNNSATPVKLTLFTAAAKGSDVLLNWTTASETNNKGFEIERSVDGRTFEKINFVKGANNSVTVINYSLTDAKAFAVRQNNVLYYRLKQIDFDGKYSYSNIVRVSKNAEAINGISVLPNPYATEYNVSFTANTEGTAMIEMIDVQGKVVATQNVSVVSGANVLPMQSASALSVGVYFVKVTLNNETHMLKIVKN
jgi:hypothetical protein